MSQGSAAALRLERHAAFNHSLLLSRLCGSRETLRACMML